MGPMIREGDATRVAEWIQEAVSDGAELLTGGDKQDQFVTPAILANVKPEMKISCDEVFGPAVGVTRVNDIDEAIAQSNVKK